MTGVGTDGRGSLGGRRNVTDMDGVSTSELSGRSCNFFKLASEENRLKQTLSIRVYEHGVPDFRQYAVSRECLCQKRLSFEFGIFGQAKPALQRSFLPRPAIRPDTILFDCFQELQPGVRVP